MVGLILTTPLLVSMTQIRLMQGFFLYWRWKMEKEKIIEEILEKEWKYFSNLNNIGGRADCQDNREDFIIMRKSQWETFNEETLLSYLEDLNSKNNPLFQKYAQMMKYNSPEEYEKIKDILEKASEKKMI